jgi:hypothetical protein
MSKPRASKPDPFFEELPATERDARQARDARRAQRARAELEAIVRELERENEALGAQVDHLLAIEAYDPSPLRITPRAAKGKDALVAVAAASDWHVEERVRPETVNGANEYTPEIAAARAEVFFRGFHRLIDLNRAGATIDRAILWLGGDLITGYIHEELLEENWLSPTEATLLAFDILVGGIDYLLARADLAELVIPCDHGNHGRTTAKTRISTSARNSFEWLLYHHLRRHYAREKRVRFNVADGRQSYTEVGPFVLRTHHGDDFRFAGGVGGLLIPLRKAVVAWNSHRQAHATMIGHWHDYHGLTAEIVNGSLIGLSPYGLSRVRAPAQEPKQAFYLIHPERLTTVGHFPIFCTEPRRGRRK